MRKRKWRKIQEGVGITLFIIMALAGIIIVGLLLIDVFTVDVPKPSF